MVEVLQNLPTELKNKVFTYQCHPVAELFKKDVLPELGACHKCFEDLNEFFPKLTRRGMSAVSNEDQGDRPNMLLLYGALFRDEHKDASRMLVKKWQDALSEGIEELDPHFFFNFLFAFFAQHHARWQNMSPSEFHEWVDENCKFLF
jgi:hypothetical protein